MNQIYRVKILKCDRYKGITSTDITQIFFRYLERKKLSVPILDDHVNPRGLSFGSVNYTLRNGLNVTVSSGNYCFVDSKLRVPGSSLHEELEIIVAGASETIRRSVEAIRNKYSADVTLEYIGVELIEGRIYRISGTMHELPPGFGSNPKEIRYEAEGRFTKINGSGVYLRDCNLAVYGRKAKTYEEIRLYIRGIKAVANI